MHAGRTLLGHDAAMRCGAPRDADISGAKREQDALVVGQTDISGAKL